MGQTDVALPVETFVRDFDLALGNPKKGYAALAEACRVSKLTPIFEWCSRSCRIVIDHPVPRLVLTALRHTATGAYVPYERMREEEGVEIVATRGRVTDLAALVAEVRAAPEGEGVVLRFDDGRMVKVKTDRYRRLHRAVEAQDPTRARWEVILHGELDRLLPLVPEVGTLADRIEAGIAREAAFVAPLLGAWRATEGLGRRERVAATAALLEGVHHLAARCVRSAREGESAEEVVRRVALEMGAGEGVRRWLG